MGELYGKKRKSKENQWKRIVIPFHYCGILCAGDGGVPGGE